MDREKKVEAILVIVVGFLALYFIFGKWRGFEVDWMLWVSLSVGVLSLMSSAIMDGITWVWFKFAHVLGNYVTGPLLLGIVFFLVLFPISIFARLFGKDHLMKKRRDGSYFVERNHAYSTEDIENIW
ncbi:MAG: SxtJ family membrane protein [Bacteroidota bacterium]